MPDRVIRPLGELSCLEKCKSTVSVTFGSRTVNAKGVMAVMSLGAKKGQEILIKVEGENEAEDAANLKAFVQEHL